MKIDPTKLLEQVAQLRREQESKQRKLEQEKGALSQLLLGLKRHFGTSDMTKAKRMQQKEEQELNQLVKRFDGMKKRVRKEMDDATD